MSTFSIAIRRKDEASHGKYRTKRAILVISDAMVRAVQMGDP